ncbi:MAG: hypothetical protein V9G23_18445 [Giesbergeria sp.]
MDWGRMDWAGGARFSTPFSYGQAHGSNRDTGAPLNSVEPAQLALGLQLDTAPWTLRFDVRHHAAKNASDIDSSAAVKAPATQFTIPAATTLDVGPAVAFAQGHAPEPRCAQPDQPQVLAVVRRAGARRFDPTTNDAYTQPGRSGFVSLVVDF